jgi:hypothetical protein
VHRQQGPLHHHRCPRCCRPHPPESLGPPPPGWRLQQQF